jgi:hypothetical protein
MVARREREESCAAGREGRMKSEEWFSEECFQYAQTTEMLVDFAKRIYTEGRRDQNKEDLDVMDSETLKMANDGGIVKYEILVRAIRAAGPREGE